MKIEIKDSDIGKRIDVAISELFPELSRTRVQKLIKERKVICNNELVVDAAKKVIAPAIIEIDDWLYEELFLLSKKLRPASCKKRVSFLPLRNDFCVLN